MKKKKPAGDIKLTNKLFEYDKYYEKDPNNYDGINFSSMLGGESLDVDEYSKICLNEIRKQKDKIKKPKKATEFEYQPVDIQQFIEDKNYLNLNKEIRPCIKKDLLTLFDGKPFDWPYDEAIFYEAIGTGKSWRAAITSIFYAYNLLCLYSPCARFGLSEGTNILIINSSINADNAKRVIFNEIVEKIKRCKWFRDHYLPDEASRGVIKFDSTPHMKRYDMGRIYKNLLIFSGTSLSTTIAGYALICGTIDEATLYPVNQYKDPAEDLRRHMRTRIKSRFGPHGLLVMCGSPQYTDDFLDRKIKELKNRKKVLIIKDRSIWEAVPPKHDNVFWFDTETYAIYEDKNLIKLTPDNILPKKIIEIPTDYYDDFKDSPTTAKKDLAGIGLSSSEPIFGLNTYKILENCNRDRTNPVNEDNTNADASCIFHPDLTWLNSEGECIDEFSYFTIHCDLGIVGDAASMAMSHLLGLDINGNPIAKIDFIYRFEPSIRNKFTISLFRKMIYYLSSRGFPIVLVTYDGFQSEDSIQILKQKGFNAQRHSVDKDITGYSLLVDYILENRLDYPYHYHFITECERLELNAKTRKVDHPEKGSKDCADAVAGSLRNLKVILDDVGEDYFYDD